MKSKLAATELSVLLGSLTHKVHFSFRQITNKSLSLDFEIVFFVFSATEVCSENYG